MKKFRYKFGVGSYILIVLGILISLTTIIINVINITKTPVLDDILSYAFAIFIAVIALAFIILVISVANYSITKKEIKTRLGIIVTGIKLNEITQIVHFSKSKRLSIIYKDNEYSNIVISEKHFDDFANEVKKNAPNIKYICCEEED